MAMKACDYCGTEVYYSETTSTPMGQVCKGCYNIFLEFNIGHTRGEFIKSIFLFLVPFLLTVYIFSGYAESMSTSDGETLMYVWLIWSAFGAFNLTKNGFMDVGDATRKEYYKANRQYDDSFEITSHTYPSYSGSQWFSIFMNIVIFAFGMAVTMFLGWLVILVRMLSYIRANSKYKNDYDHNLSFDEKRVDLSFFDAYKGVLFDKTMDYENDPVSTIDGYNYEHVGYAIHDDELYATLMALEDTPKHQKDKIQFLKLIPRSTNYQWVEPGGELYETLWESVGDDSEDEEITDINDDALSAILDQDNSDFVTLAFNGERKKYKQLYVSVYEDLEFINVVLLDASIPVEDADWDDLEVFRIFDDTEETVDIMPENQEKYWNLALENFNDALEESES